MTLPWRDFTEFEERDLRARDPNGSTYNAVTDWDTTRYPNRRRQGEHRFSAGNDYEKELAFFRVKGGHSQLVPTGLEWLVNFEIDLTYAKEKWIGGCERWVISSLYGIETRAVVNTEDSDINWNNFSGRYKDQDVPIVWDGILNAQSTPRKITWAIAAYTEIYPADEFVEINILKRSIVAGTAFWEVQEGFVTDYTGLWLAQGWQEKNGAWAVYRPFLPDDEMWAVITPKRIKVQYFAPITNAISTLHWSAAGGTTVVFTGQNYEIPNADLNETAQPAISWDVFVTEIDVIGLQGQGTTTLTGGGVDFTVDNDGQITITSTPALTPGTYELRFKSEDHTAHFNLENLQYAGDWRTDPVSRLTPGVRFVILARGEDDGDDEDDGDGDDEVTDWEWKDEDGNTFLEYLAPMDTRAPDVFYHGRILSNTSHSREVNDRTGMFSVGDMTFELANNDKHYSALLATHFLKNQTVGIYHVRRDRPEAWKTSMIKMVVDDYELEGPVFRVHCKDVTNKYFQVTIPRNIIEEDFYPDAHESVLGQPMPDILGLHSLGGQTPGAVEARLIDTVTFKYIAAAGSLHSVTNVYSEGVLQTEGAVNDYTISYEDGGRTYINFNADQEEKKITFNCTGYTHAPWNSVNGYVQNPAYVILFVLAFLLEIPATRLDLASFDETAVVMGTLEVHTAGRWIGQEGATGENVIQELLWTYGAKLFVDRDGNLKLERKDLSNIATDVWVFDQIHCMKPTRRMFGLNEIVNVVKANYDYYPTASLFKSIVEVRNETSITNYEAESEGLIDPALKWTDSLTLAQLRTIEELIKYSEGYKKAEFVLPFRMIDDLDIMDNFRFQDPFGVAADGGGEFGRYYYVVSLRPNHMNMTLEVTAIDLTWLIEQESGSGSG